MMEPESSCSYDQYLEYFAQGSTRLVLASRCSSSVSFFFKDVHSLACLDSYGSSCPPRHRGNLSVLRELLAISCVTELGAEPVF